MGPADNKVLLEYQQLLEGTLGAIAAHLVLGSKDSSRVIRDCSKLVDNLSVDLRKSLIDFDKSLATTNDTSSTN